MKEYLEKALHISVDETPYRDTDALPLGIKNGFGLSIVHIDSRAFLMVTPKEKTDLTELRKLRIRLERLTGFPCAFCLKTVNSYAVDKMVEEGIPFVWEGRQIYLPFLGMLLKPCAARAIGHCARISFLTQKLLLMALYEGYRDMPASQAADRLGVTRMSVTRCYDEIEALEIPYLRNVGRSRRFDAPEDKRAMWTTIRPHLRDPVIRTFRPMAMPQAGMLLSGTSALAEYSMLNDDGVMTYAVCKDRVGALGIKDLREAPIGVESACVIHEVGYVLTFGNSRAIDPLSLTLILTERDIDDPRVESCIDEMLEEWVW